MIRYLASGDTALVVEFGDTIDRALNALVLGLVARMTASPIDGVIETVPTFRSLMVHYDPGVIGFDDLKGRMADLVDGLEPHVAAGRHWHLPTCYEAEFAPDLEDVARRTGLSTGDVVRLHAGVTYTVYALGFLPGCPYLGDLVAELELPRRETPRVRVPKGGVGMAMRMTNIYPLESPGGWHLIGRTPVWLFDRRRDEAVLLAPGDAITFEPVPRGVYDRLERAADAGELPNADLLRGRA